MMQIGMLWLDEAPARPLQARVAEAVNYYRRKYGQSPTVCYVHHSALPPDKEKVHIAGVEVRPLDDILPHHLWLGMDETASRPQKSQKSAVAAAP